MQLKPVMQDANKLELTNYKKYEHFFSFLFSFPTYHDVLLCDGGMMRVHIICPHYLGLHRNGHVVKRHELE